MIETIPEIALNPDGTLADCKARMAVNMLWTNHVRNWKSPEILEIELRALFTEHPDWNEEPGVHSYIMQLFTPSTTEAAETYTPGTPIDTADYNYHLTDLGNAQRFASDFGKVIRYSYKRDRWIVWRGKCWVWDTGEQVMQFAHKTALSIYSEASSERLEKDERKEIVAWAKSSEANIRLLAMINQAKSLLSIELECIDSNPWLLNMKNGTLNLQTGELFKHNPDDFITRLIDIAYSPEAESREWQLFLERIFEDADTISYIQRALGYSITGSQQEQAFFFGYGTGANGKTTLLSAIRKVLGDYAIEIEPSAFMLDKNRNNSGPNEAIASLAGKRLAISTELSDGQRFNSSLLKRMCGGEQLFHERKYEHGFSFMPTHKLWISGNSKPAVSDTSDGFWRRMKLIGFMAKITEDERIPGYDDVLVRDCGESILAWLVQGCYSWQEHSLKEEPDSVRQATIEYREAEDVLHDFVNQECILDAVESISVADLFRAYQSWCGRNDDKYPLGKRSFNVSIEHRGIVKYSGTANKQMWRGIRLKPSEEKDDS